MNTMRMTTWILAAAWLAGGASTARAQAPAPAPAKTEEQAHPSGWRYDEGLRYESADGEFELAIGGRIQVRLTGEKPDFGDTSQSFDIPRLKLSLDGRAFKEWKFALQADFARGSDANMELLEDANLTWDRYRLLRVWAGQGKVFFGRQSLTSTGDLEFVDRALAAVLFQHTQDGSQSRDQGLAVTGEGAERRWEYQVGLYNGNGINKDAKDNSDYMVTARFVFMPFGDCPLRESDPERSGDLRLAVGLAGMQVTRGTGALDEKVDEITGGLEIALKFAGFDFNAEYFARGEDLPQALPDDTADADGWYAQAGWVFPFGLGVAARYSEANRDEAGVHQDASETGAAVSWYLSGHRHKLQADYRVLAFSEQVSPNIDRDEFRLQLQLGF